MRCKLLVPLVLLLTSLPGQEENAAPGDLQDAQWLEPFLGRIPDRIAAVAVVAMQPHDFLVRVRGLLMPAEIDRIEEWLQSTGRREAFEEPLEKADAALLPRIGFVIGRDIGRDPAIPVEVASPIPQIACVFWIREGESGPLEDIRNFMIRNYRALAFESAFELKLAPDVDSTIVELTNRKIPATGEVAIGLMGDLLVLGNSAGLVRSLLRPAVAGTPSFSGELSDLSLADPESASNLALIHGRHLWGLLGDQEIERPDAGFMMAVRGLVERGEITFDPGMSIDEERQAFDRNVATFLDQVVDEQENVRMTLTLDGVVELSRLLAGR